MAIVARGLGQPEDGSLVAGGLGATEPDLNAMVAVITATGSLSGTLTAANEEPTESGGGAARPRMRYERVPKPEQFTLTDDDLAALALVLLEV